MDFRTVFALALTLTVVASQKLKLNNGKFLVDWTLAADKKSISFNATVDATGWIGMGFSPSGNMNGADMVIALPDNPTATTLKVQDYWSAAHTLPTLDTKQDLVSTNGTRDIGTGKVFIEFSRPINTTETTQDLVLPLDGIYVIWAISSSQTLVHHDISGKSEALVIFDDLGETTTKAGVSGIHGMSLLIPAIITFQLFKSY